LSGAKHSSGDFTFKMSEVGQTIKIFSQGEPAFKDGQEVKACGKYEMSKSVGSQTFRDEVEASTSTITVAVKAAKETPKTDAKAAPAKEETKALPAEQPAKQAEKPETSSGK